MRKIVVAILLLMPALPVLALVEGNQVAYVSGTTSTVKAGSTGTLDTTDKNDLVFNSSEGTLRIPYARMDHIGYHTDVARHLGVLPAMAAGLVRKRERKHFLEVSYHDASGAIQVAQFELAKGVPATLLPVLNARAPKACSAKFPEAGCTVPKTYGP
jgi:hypothetical protein